jgi:adenylylsulfate kinase
VSWAIWITGPPGSGKSALAREAAATLRRLGEPVTVLELDEIRAVLTPRPAYSAGEREAVYRGLAWMAGLLVEAGAPVIVDATAHRRAWRERARRAIPRFAEVQLVCPSDVCRARERTRQGSHAPPGIYAQAGRPGATVPGVDVPYEPAAAPELLLDTVAEEVPEAAGRIVALARRLRAGGPAARPGGGPSWVVWITGPGGSGKTTLAQGMAEALRRRGIPVRILDAPGVSEALLPSPRGADWELDLVHRGLVYAAKLLSEAGAPVVIDATAPRRAWRELARTLIRRFAEVELECPVELCLERARVVRWHPAAAGGPRRAGAGTAGERLDYEASWRPDLTVRTDFCDPWTAVADLVALGERLERATAQADHEGRAALEAGE